jgi:putative component of toxin-antitoxin plasmid stabilization module
MCSLAMELSAATSISGVGGPARPQGDRSNFKREFESRIRQLPTNTAADHVIVVERLRDLRVRSGRSHRFTEEQVGRVLQDALENGRTDCSWTNVARCASAVDMMQDWATFAANLVPSLIFKRAAFTD